MWNLQKQHNKLRHRKEMAEMDKGGKKVQSSSYNINKFCGYSHHNNPS